MEIIVRGYKGEGKSTIALLIKEALEREGFTSATIADDEGLIPLRPTPEEQQTNITSLKSVGTKIHITTQVARQFMKDQQDKLDGGQL